jgi:hypothetical protein
VRWSVVRSEGASETYIYVRDENINKPLVQESDKPDVLFHIDTAFGSSILSFLLGYLLLAPHDA